MSYQSHDEDPPPVSYPPPLPEEPPDRMGYWMTVLAVVVISVTLLFCLLRCQPLPEPEPPPPGPEGGGTIADCPAACETILQLHCLEAWGIEPADGACLSMCEAAENTPGDTMCPALVAGATSCDEANRLSQCGTE